MQSSAIALKRPSSAQLLRDLGRVITRGWDELGVALFLCCLLGALLAQMEPTENLFLNIALLGFRLFLNAYLCLFTFCILTDQRSPGIFDRFALVHPSAYVWQAFLVAGTLFGGLFAIGIPWLMVVSGLSLMICVVVCENPRDLQAIGRSLRLTRGHRWWLSQWIVPFLIPGWALVHWLIDPVLTSPEIPSTLVWIAALCGFIALDAVATVALTIGYYRIRRLRGELPGHFSLDDDAESSADLGTHADTDRLALGATATAMGSEASSFQQEYFTPELTKEELFQQKYFYEPPTDPVYDGPVGGDSVVGLSDDEDFYREYFDEKIHSGVMKHNVRFYEHPWVWTAEALGLIDRDRD